MFISYETPFFGLYFSVRKIQISFVINGRGRLVDIKAGMHGCGSGNALLVNAEVDSMGGVVDGGVGSGIKTSPRRAAIEKAQAELRYFFDAFFSLHLHLHLCLIQTLRIQVC